MNSLKNNVFWTINHHKVNQKEKGSILSFDYTCSLSINVLSHGSELVPLSRILHPSVPFKSFPPFWNCVQYSWLTRLSFFLNVKPSSVYLMLLPHETVSHSFCRSCHTKSELRLFIYFCTFSNKPLCFLRTASSLLDYMVPKFL